MSGTSAGRRHPARRALAVTVVLLGASVLSACDSGNGGETSPSTLAPAPTTRPSTVQSQEVDLEVTGVRSATLRGAKGTCRSPAGGLPKVFVVSDPALGTDGYLYVFAETAIAGRRTVPANVKLFIDGIGLISPPTGTGVRVASDLQSVTLDTELTGTRGPSRNDAAVTTGIVRGHVRGSIRCT